MPFLIVRLAQYLRVRLRGWRMPLAVALFVFLTSWGVMALVEPADSDIASPDTYWWYFVVTSATVGYGDVFPVSTIGRIVGVYVIVGGIVTLTLLFTQLASALQSVRGRRTRGVIALDLSDHVVLLGYHPGRTERIVAELTADKRFEVVLCAWDDVGEDPLPDYPDVHFVRGDLTNEDVMTRACVDRARTAVIDARDDNETLAIAVAVDHANPQHPPGGRAARPEPARHPPLHQRRRPDRPVAHAVPADRGGQRPRHHQIYSDLMTSGGHGNTYSVRIPGGFPHTTFGDCQTWFGRTFGATVLALRAGDGLEVSPPWDRPVPEGSTLYYVAGERIAPDRLPAAR